jgi:hypothetical protein
MRLNSGARDSDPAWSWPSIPKADFEALMDKFQYLRHGFEQEIVFVEKETNRILGYIHEEPNFATGIMNATYHLRPDLFTLM